MASSRDDFKHLRVPLAVALVLVAAGIGGVAAMQKWTGQAKLEQAQVETARNEAQGRLARAREEEQEIKLNMQQYRTLASQGIVGEENRLDWIERIAAIKAARKLYDIRYEISEQKREDNSPVSGPEIMVSRMLLTLPLLHEEDLFHLLADLRAANRGYFQVKGCTISRGLIPADRRILAPTLDANCMLDFYTIRERAAPKPAGS
jgi:hypothetical protein